MKGLVRKAVFGFILIVLLFMVLNYLVSHNILSVIAIIFWGLIIIISIFLILKSKKSILGAWIGFLIPWLYYVYKDVTCVGSHCGHLGTAIPTILIVSIVTGLIGGILGKILFKK